MANFFINRPVFAWVIAIILMMAGALSITNLPMAQYPSIAPPAVSITVTDPGASAETVQSTVVQVIEQQLNGIDNLIYFSSESNKDGSMTITLNFKQGTNPDIAQVQVQNKLQLATPLLPPEVQQQGIRVAKATVNFLLAIAFVSTDGSTHVQFWQIYFLTAPHRWITLVLVATDPSRREGRTWLFILLAILALALVWGVWLSTGAFVCLLLIDYLWNGWHFASQHAVQRVHPAF